MSATKGGQGKALETEINLINSAYRMKGLARIEKVDPPTRVVWKRGVGGASKPFTLQLENPFLDYVGVWRERAGRAIVLEAKSTEKPVLRFVDESGGLTEKQWAELQVWTAAGAATGLLWGHGGEIRYVPMPALHAARESGRKSLRWENATPLKRGTGLVTWDYLQALRDYHPA